MDEIDKAGQEAIKPEAEASAITIPQYCIRDGSEMYEGVKFGFPAWICPSCTYWKLKN